MAHFSISTESKSQQFLCASPDSPARCSHFDGKVGALILTSIYKASWMPLGLCCPSDFPSWGHSTMCCTFRTTAGYLGGLPPPTLTPPSVSSKVRKVTHSTPVCGHVSARGRPKKKDSAVTVCGMDLVRRRRSNLKMQTAAMFE